MHPQEPTTTMADIERMVGIFSRRLATLNAICQKKIDAIERINQSMHREITEAIAHTVVAREQLRTTIKANPHLFDKPKTVTICGVRVGLMKQKGKVEFDDEEKVIGRIRTQLPKDQAALLIRITEELHKPGVYDLTAGDLKRLGIRIVDDCDAVVIKPVDSNDSGKIAAKLLDSATPVEGNA